MNHRKNHLHKRRSWDKLRRATSYQKTERVIGLDQMKLSKILMTGVITVILTGIFEYFGISNRPAAANRRGEYIKFVINLTQRSTKQEFIGMKSFRKIMLSLTQIRVLRTRNTIYLYPQLYFMHCTFSGLVLLELCIIECSIIE